ncbi:unnamed protein product, partial [Didymodactylos carnosus]
MHLHQATNRVKYRQHKPKLFIEKSSTDLKPEIDSGTTNKANRASISAKVTTNDGGEDKNATTTTATTMTSNVQMKNDMTLEESLGEFLHVLKKYNNTNLSTEQGLKALFSLLKRVTNLEDLKTLINYEKDLKTSIDRKSFLDKYRLKIGNEEDLGQRYVLAPNLLQLICCLWDQYEPLPMKDHCYLFLSHRPNERQVIEKNKMYQRMIKKYKVQFRERITMAVEKRAQAEEGETEEVVIREKEKGVDTHIAIEIANVISGAAKTFGTEEASEDGQKRVDTEAKDADTHIVLVSSDADFTPVVEKAIENNVSIDIWCWERSTSAVYRKFLKGQNSKVRCFYLDRYLYQIG